ncbi:hypothetical protein [Anaplasma phagocytophilum]|nr:hypothetical protein [Anaplasma phagocytophilum]
MVWVLLKQRVVSKLILFIDSDDIRTVPACERSESRCYRHCTWARVVAVLDAGYFNFILLLNSKVIGISTATCHIISSLTIRKAARSAISSSITAYEQSMTLPPLRSLAAMACSRASVST